MYIYTHTYTHRYAHAHTHHARAEYAHTLAILQQEARRTEVIHDVYILHMYMYIHTHTYIYTQVYHKYVHAHTHHTRTEYARTLDILQQEARRTEVIHHVYIVYMYIYTCLYIHIYIYRYMYTYIHTHNTFMRTPAHIHIFTAFTLTRTHNKFDVSGHISRICTHTLLSVV